MRIHPLTLCVFAVATLWLAPATHANSQTIALLGVTGEDVGRVSDIEDAVRAGLTAAGHDSVPAGVSDLDEALLLIGCPTASPDCLTSLADVLGVDQLLYGSVVSSDEGDALSLTCFDAAVGTWRFSSNIPLFDVPEGIRAAEDATRALLSDASVLVVSGPADAVLVDGTIRRALPTVVAADSVQSQWDVEVAGERVGVVRAPAGSGARVVRANADPIVDDVARTPVERGTSSTLRITGWSLAAITVVLAGATTAQGLATGRTQRAFDRNRIQREAYDLAEQGHSQARTTNTLLGFTLASAATAATLLVLEYTGDDRSDASVGRGSVGVAPTRGGVHGTVGFSF